MMVRAIVLVREYFESVDGERRGLGVEDVPVVEGNGDELLDEPDWKLD